MSTQRSIAHRASDADLRPEGPGSGVPVDRTLRLQCRRKMVPDASGIEAHNQINTDATIHHRQGA